MACFIIGTSIIIVSLLIAIEFDDSGAVAWFVNTCGWLFILYGCLSHPTAMDLHAGKAVIKYEVVNGIKVDSTFVFKDEIK